MYQHYAVSKRRANLLHHSLVTSCFRAAAWAQSSSHAKEKETKDAFLQAMDLETSTDRRALLSFYCCTSTFTRTRTALGRSHASHLESSKLKLNN